MTERRRRDGDDDAIDRAQAAGPRSGPPGTGRPGDGGASEGTPRVHGAWTTPAVVVRRPDGSIVNRDDPEPSTGRTPRVRPRRIPGAPGAVLIRATLTPGVDGREVRRGPRSAASSSTPLPPRPAERRDGAPSDGAPPARPSLRALSSASPGKAGRTRVRRRTRGPASRRDGSRRQRVAAVVAGLNFDRLVPGDDEARQRRAARLRRVSARLAAVALVVVVVYGVFPVRTWIDQRAATDRARERLEVFERENELLASEKRDLSTDERIEEEAREMGFVMPGEESYGVYPAPEEAPPSGTTSTTRPGG